MDWRTVQRLIPQWIPTYYAPNLGNNGAPVSMAFPDGTPFKVFVQVERGRWRDSDAYSVDKPEVDAAHVAELHAKWEEIAEVAKQYVYDYLNMH